MLSYNQNMHGNMLNKGLEKHKTFLVTFMVDDKLEKNLSIGVGK